MTHLLASTATIAAFLGILRTDRRALQVMLGLASPVYLAALLNPDWWTQEVFGLCECAVGFLAVLAGLGVARRARTGPEAMFTALMFVLISAAFGVFWLRYAPYGSYWGYRGVAFVDLAACAVLATVYDKRLESYLDFATVKWLALAFGLTCVQCLTFELSLFLARFFGWLQIAAWTVGMVLLARAGFSHSAPRSST